MAVENAQWDTAATMADETATEADTQSATAATMADETATADTQWATAAVDETATEANTHWATAATIAEETATDQHKADTRATVAYTQATVANAQHKLRATHYDH